MRLWHKDLIEVLPRQQLLAQWRELCAIVANIDTKGTPNHLLVDKVLLYPTIHLVLYSDAILQEFHKRGYKVSEESYTTLCERLQNSSYRFNNQPQTCSVMGLSDIYKSWHNNRYFIQCYCNLQEKFDCGGLTVAEWSKIVKRKADLHIGYDTL